jgi:hypothetical protein
MMPKMPTLDIWEGLEMEPFGIYLTILHCYFHMVYFIAAFKFFCGHFGAFFPFWFVEPKKIRQPCMYVGIPFLGLLGHFNGLLT